MKLLILINVWILCQKVYTRENDICGEKQCVQKCCPEKQFVQRRQCITYSEALEIGNFSVRDKTTKPVGVLKDYFDIKLDAFKNETFKQNTLNADSLYNAIYLIENGTMLMHRPKTDDKSQLVAFNTEEFCLDYLLQTNKSPSIKAWIIPKKQKTRSENKNLLSLCALSISCCFLILVLVVYSLLQELRTLGGMVLMGYVTSLLFAFIFLAVIQSIEISKFACVVFTLIIYYSFISSFCWMNVMSYDIWWTFRGYAKARPIHRRGIRFKFVMYCLYSSVLPLLLTILTAVMTNQNISGVIVPQIPLYGCFLRGKAKIAYLYGPMLIMILVNWTLFGMTAFNIWRLSSGTSVIDAADSSVTGNASAHRNNKQRLIVYMKLSVLMGLTWIFEVVSSYKPELNIWYLTDTYNMLIGFVIFVILVCKKKILIKLKKRFQQSKPALVLTSSSSTKSRSTLESNTQNVPLKAVF